MQEDPKVVVVGAGHLGTYHLQKMSTDASAELLGVVDVDLPRAQRAAAQHGVQATGRLADFAGRADAVVIATPTASHLEVAAEAFGLGFDVLVEKPMAPNSADARHMIALAQQAGRLLQVGHTERFNPAVAAGLGIADRARYIVAERLGPFTGRSTDVDVVLDLMIHDLDIVAALVSSPLVEVRAIGVPVLTDATDMASARLAFADGTVAQLSAGRASLEPSRRIRLFTAQRYVSIDCGTREVKSVRRLPAVAGSDWPQITGEPVEVPDRDALADQDHHFIRCVRSRETPQVDGAAGLRALCLAESVKEALEVPLPRAVSA